jgi:hypothetical protein
MQKEAKDSLVLCLRSGMEMFAKTQIGKRMGLDVDVDVDVDVEQADRIEDRGRED